MLVGTRLLVRQVVATVKAHDGDVDETAEYFSVPPRVVRAAIAYYAEFVDEIDADSAWAARLEADEYTRWQREQATMA